jgi:hypothetical protein
MKSTWVHLAPEYVRFCQCERSEADETTSWARRGLAVTRGEVSGLDEVVVDSSGEMGSGGVGGRSGDIGQNWK